MTTAIKLVATISVINKDDEYLWGGKAKLFQSTLAPSYVT